MKTVVPHQPPDFSAILKERAEQLTFDVDKLEVGIADVEYASGSFTFPIQWHTSQTWIKLDLVPFATGQLRHAYFLQDLGESKRSHLLVAKFCIQNTNSSAYLSDVEMQAVCAHYAKLYNEHDPPLKVEYVRSWLLKVSPTRVSRSHMTWPR